MSSPATPDQQLSAWLAETCARLAVPGAVIGVVHGDDTRFACSGVTSVTDPLAVDEDTLFFIGSTTKTLTATALMALVEAGRLSLDDRVVDHLPGLQLADAGARDAVKVGHLVDHTAGWVGDASADTGWGDDALERAIPQLVGEREQLSPPGAIAHYNNAAVVLAGHLIAVLEGETYEQVIRRLVLDPLGMANTWFLPWEVANRRLAVGHVVGPDGAQPEYEWPIGRAIGPAGTAISSVVDQLRYLRFCLDGSGSNPAPISDETRRSMRDLRVWMGSGIDGVGVSWLLRDYGGVQVVEHGGNVSNLQVSSFAFVPELGLGVTTMANSAGGRQLGSLALDHVLERFTDWARLPPPAPLDVDAPTAAEYAGTYAAGQWDLVVEHDVDGLSVRMRLKDLDEEISDELRDQFEAPTQLALVAPDVVAPRADTTRSAGDFIRDGGGRVAFLRYGLRLAPKVS